MLINGEIAVVKNNRAQLEIEEASKDKQKIPRSL